ncbi:MAG: glycosyltransferase [Candidatus Bathyarchaeia archaeon]|jgi:glycosyltransferase involved in cell wall biosynthesis
MSRCLSVAIVHRLTPKTNYSRLLNKGFKQSKSNTRLLLYGWAAENLSDLPNAKPVWTSSLFPLQIFNQLLKDKPAVVHIQYEFTTFGKFWTNIFFPLLLLTIKLTGVKTVVTVHSVIPKAIIDKQLMKQLLPQFPKGLFGQILFKAFLVYIYGTTVSLSDQLVVHGKWYKKTLINSYKARADKIHVIPYGVDAEPSVNSALLEKWRKATSCKKLVLFFGNISPRKDIETLIRAFAIFNKKHDNYLLVIAGKDSSDYKGYSDHLKNLSNDLNISNKTLFLGFVEDAEIHVLYNLSEFIVFPYLYGFEGPSGPLSFAIQHGLPVVGTNVGHLSEEITDMQDGLLLSPRDVNGFANAMAKLADDGDLRDRFSNNLKRRADGMLWTDVAMKTSAIYSICRPNSLSIRS